MNWRVAARLGLLAVFFTASASAQSGNEGSLEGTVTDPSGAVVPGVELKIRNVNTSAGYPASTDDRGVFRFLVLPVGTYELVARRGGFATLIQKDVVVTVGAKISLSLTLQLAGLAESVVVTGATPLVETTRSQVSSTLDQRLISSLPVNGRNFTDFIVLAPGVIRGPVLISFGSGIPSFGGQRSLSITLVDGAENTSVFSTPFPAGVTPYQFSLEVVREFQVNTNSYSAELGHAGNGLINVITKSGSNDFHGSLFWFYRDQGLNATDLIRKNAGQPKEPLHIHQIGAAGGGPIVRNTFFFFAGFDGQRRQLQNLTLLNLPTGFSLSPIPVVAAFQQRALDYLAPRAVPYLRALNQDVYFTKLDWQITPTQLLSGRWNTQQFTGGNSTGAGQSTSLENNGVSLATNHTLALSLSTTITSSIVNAARFSYLLSDEPNQSNSVNPQANIFEGGQLALIIGRAIQNPQRTFVRQFEWTDSLCFSQRHHAFKIGVNVLLARNRWEHAPSFSGNFRFNSLESFGRNLAGTLAPQAGETFIQAFSGAGTPGVRPHPNSTEFAGFFQDGWRAHPNLTLNLGLRYDIQVMAKPQLKNPSPALAARGLDTSFVPLDGNNFAPRFGFAWSLLRSQRLVVRGGYGLFYARLRAAVAVRAHYQNGVSVQTRTFTGASIPTYPNTLCGLPDSSGTPPICPPLVAGSDTIMLFARDYVQPYAQHASFGFEYQLRDDWAISASYLMTRGSHLQRWRDVNLSAPAPTNIGIAGASTVLTYQRFAAPRPISGFDRIFLLTSDANSIYHGMAVQLNKRFSHNFQFLAGYTLGKVMDDRPESLVFNPGGASDALLLSNSFEPRADRSSGVEDARHRLVLSGVWDLSIARGLRGPEKATFGGWQLSGMLAVQSGFPYSGLVNFDLNNDGNSLTDRTPGQPRNMFHAPVTVSFDPRITRSISLKERVRLQFIWEAFNVLNRANITDVRTTQFSRSTALTACGIAGTPCLVPQNTGSNAFGAPSATLGPRIMQFALKLLF